MGSERNPRILITRVKNCVTIRIEREGRQIWLFTRLGFYSATAGDDNKIQVRARSADHLRNLKAEFPELLDKHKILEIPNRDYAYRLILTKEEWAKVSAKLTSEVEEYSNFKGECLNRVRKGKLDGRYEQMLHTIWSTHHQYQMYGKWPAGQNKKGKQNDWDCYPANLDWSDLDTQDVLGEQELDDPYNDEELVEEEHPGLFDSEFKKRKPLLSEATLETVRKELRGLNDKMEALKQRRLRYEKQNFEKRDYSGGTRREPHRLDSGPIIPPIRRIK